MQKVHAFNRVKLFRQIIISSIALLFHVIECVCPVLIPLEWFCGCALLLTFKCAIFDRF